MATRDFAKLLLFFLSLVFSLSLVSSESSQITLNFPEQITQKQSFKVSISLQNPSVSTYDVKIFVGKATKEYSEVFFNNKWQSPFNYLKEAFPSTSEFTIRANIPEETKLCARLRPSNEKSFEESCSPITVLASEPDSSEEPNLPEEETKSKAKSSSYSSKKSLSSSQNSQSSIEPLASSSQSTVKTPSSAPIAQTEKIILNSPQTLNSNKVIETQKQTFLKFLTYSFIFFLVLLIILLALNKL